MGNRQAGFKIDNVTQVRIGRHTTVIIGLKSALSAAAARCQGMKRRFSNE